MIALLSFEGLNWEHCFLYRNWFVYELVHWQPRTAVKASYLTSYAILQSALFDAVVLISRWVHLPQEKCFVYIEIYWDTADNCSSRTRAISSAAFAVNSAKIKHWNPPKTSSSNSRLGSFSLHSDVSTKFFLTQLYRFLSQKGQALLQNSRIV